jgi:hypothetical protein
VTNTTGKRTRRLQYQVYVRLLILVVTLLRSSHPKTSDDDAVSCEYWDENSTISTGTQNAVNLYGTCHSRHQKRSLSNLLFLLFVPREARRSLNLKRPISNVDSTTVDTCLLALFLALTSF